MKNFETKIYKHHLKKLESAKKELIKEIDSKKETIKIINKKIREVKKSLTKCK